MLAQCGWTDPIDLGPLAAARGLEGMMPFWLRMWGVVGSADFNYRIVRGCSGARPLWRRPLRSLHDNKGR